MANEDSGVTLVNGIVVLTEPPYEVTEFGWGEFETRIQLHFHDPNEKPVDIIHMLALYPPNNQPASTKKVRESDLRTLPWLYSRLT
jgi:transcription initiation factor IIF auxiliary subunit